MSCARRYKIEKKAKEKHRKDRRDARRSGLNSSNKKKDPGIPNLFPFKEKMLNQIEESKRKVEEERERQKKARLNVHMQNRSMENIGQDAQKRAEAFEQKEREEVTMEKEEEDLALTGDRDNSRKAYIKEFRKVVENSDVILEVLDARDPMGTRAKQIEEMIKDMNKRLVLVLNKIDLVPKENVQNWLQYLRQEHPTVAFKASTQEQRSNLSQGSISKTAECVGAEGLLHILKNYTRNLNIKTAVTVGLVGFPNVGKSSVINSMKRARVCGVGSTPGLTKHVQMIHLDKTIRLLDSPGVVFSLAPKSGSDASKYEAVLRNCIKVDLLTDPVGPAELIISRCNPAALTKLYNVNAFVDSNDFLIQLARQKGRLKRGGIPDILAAARSLLSDWNAGKIPYYSLPPKVASTPVVHQPELVSDFSKQFDLFDDFVPKNSTFVSVAPSSAADLSFTSNPIEMNVDSDSDSEDDSEGDAESDIDMNESTNESYVVNLPVASSSSSSSAPLPVSHEKPVITDPQLNKAIRKNNKANSKKLKKKLAVSLKNAQPDGDEYDFADHFDSDDEEL
ncbi:Guanine nucleotide-binding protein-like-like protein [Zancudomyces culisetae]|uniref:Guanine nucleotide-binding protein-like-like protein n=1 Tax=Zancudomyces culisetae TaxID=1213189 RepID=A0A1R1PKW6_ZANCU|nr:Guanine nucleotide-binding protein-like-like protein [Zancudomyces culisetae]|eukprot:OMH81512.1 Guanine nucleotide-binding protein-like-like protein [Zancudomyces culisetae]